MPTTPTFPHEDKLADAWERAYGARLADPGAPGVMEAEDAAWADLADTIHERGHAIDTCTCRSCTHYRRVTDIED